MAGVPPTHRAIQEISLEACDRRALLRFIRLPRAIYPATCPWVSPLDGERLRFFDLRRNPFWRHATARLFLAVDGRGRGVGRIAAIDNPRHAELHGRRVGFFGFFDCLDDTEAARSLFGAAEAWLLARGLPVARGPVSPSTNHECGCLVSGFERPPKLLMAYHPEHTARLIESCGYRGAQDLVAYEAPIDGAIPARLLRAEEVFRRRRSFTVRPVDLRRFGEELARVLVVYNEAWSANYGFVPLTPEEIRWLGRELRPLIHPDLCRIAEVAGESAGIMIALPDVNQALRPLRGRLWPLGWWKLLAGLRRVDALHGLVLGIRPRFRGLGIDYAFYLEGLRAAQARGYRSVELSWVLAHNVGILRALERLGARETKRYRLFERALA